MGIFGLRFFFYPRFCFRFPATNPCGVIAKAGKMDQTWYVNMYFVYVLPTEQHFSWEQRIIGIWHSVAESLGYLSQIIHVFVVADRVFFGISMCCILITTWLNISIVVYNVESEVYIHSVSCMLPYHWLHSLQYFRFNKHYDAIMTYISQGHLMLSVDMHKPTAGSRNIMDALLAFWPGLQVRGVSKYMLILNWGLLIIYL